MTQEPTFDGDRARARVSINSKGNVAPAPHHGAPKRALACPADEVLWFGGARCWVCGAEGMPAPRVCAGSLAACWCSLPWSLIGDWQVSRSGQERA